MDLDMQLELLEEALDELGSDADLVNQVLRTYDGGERKTHSALSASALKGWPVSLHAVEIHVGWMELNHWE